MHKFHAHFVTLDLLTCTTCLESFLSLQLHLESAECLRCSPGQVYTELILLCQQHVSWPYTCYVILCNCSFLTQVEETLISGVLPIMSLYRLPHGQYTYSGHIINLPQDVASFVNSLPRLPTELDIIVVRKQGAADSHHDFRVRGL